MKKIMRINILKAIIHREFLEYLNNSQAVLLLGMTVGLNSLLFFALGSTQMVLTLNMSLVMMGFTNTMMLFAEEKDQKTLDALLTTPVRYQEIIAGKLFVNYLITFVCTITVFWVLHRSDITLLHLFLSISQGAMIFCLLGMSVGIVLPNQKVASSFGSLIMLTLFLPEFLARVNSNVSHFARGLPTYYLNNVLSLSTEASFGEIGKYYIVIFLFLVVSIMLVLSFIKNLLVQESPKWKYSSENKSVIGIFIVLAIVGSFLFRPINWEKVQVSGNDHYVNPNYQLSIPFLGDKDYSHKSIDDKNSSTVIFKRKDDGDHYIFVKTKRNWKKETIDQYLNRKKEKWLASKNKTSMVISSIERRDGAHFIRASFNDKEGANLIYHVVTRKWIYQVGIVQLKALVISESIREKLIGYFDKVDWDLN